MKPEKVEASNIKTGLMPGLEGFRTILRNNAVIGLNGSKGSSSAVSNLLNGNTVMGNNNIEFLER